MEVMFSVALVWFGLSVNGQRCQQAFMKFSGHVVTKMKAFNFGGDLIKSARANQMEQSFVPPIPAQELHTHI